jgi:hypothetical protein
MVVKLGPNDDGISTMMVDTYVELEPCLLFTNVIRLPQIRAKNLKGTKHVF